MQHSESGRSPFQDQRVLSGRQRGLLVLIGVGSMLEFWDAYLIGFIMAFLIKPWGLTYGVMGAVLLASGAGAVVGGMVWGAIADRLGRKPVFVASLLLLALASVGLALTPDGGWIYMAVLRIVIGFCTGGYFIQIALVNEFMPPQRRATLTGVVSAITTGGLLLGAFSGAFLIPALGWRWTFGLGAAPALIALLGVFLIPESPRWLAQQGRQAAAREAVAWALAQPVHMVAAPAAPPTASPAADAALQARPRWRDIFHYPRSVVTATLVNMGLISGYYGIVLWSPTLLSQVQRLSPARASMWMIAFSVLGMGTRLGAALLADRIGRRKTGGYFAIVSAVALFVAGYVGHGDLLTPAWFWAPLLLAFVFADGSFAICAVYSTEIWPTRLRGSGAGFAGLTGSVGKMLGPMGLALVAGSSSVVMPGATLNVIVPAFQFLAFCLLVCGLTYLLIGIEARGETLETLDTRFENERNTRRARASRDGTAVRNPATRTARRPTRP
ncbi:MFS transporter [Chitinasiproducens palmae]|uniref:MFS transporter, putative metabolite:H+ symporter n=1 Tax=Chitinasiproducens palmae TaxID=1770053 RepID=A0A1H2PTY1_9BURK|nr:MFS transporter [Chitinasiproducens palmae]SDV50607.1 MFS transporter, putative metabolite:H+ symporter [Chitinasiproducens palmae]